MKNLKMLIMVMSSMVLMSCGGDSKKWVTDVNVETATQGDESWLVSDFKLDIGENELPFISSPLPKDYGVFRSWRLDGENYIGVDLNLTSILDVRPGLGTLPNGQPIPVEIGQAGIIEVEIEKINGKVYLAKSGSMTLVGLAVAIEQLDGLATDATGIFPIINLGGFDVAAGVFTSGEAGGTGIGIFANIGSLWDEFVYDASAFEFRSEYVSRSKKRRIFKKLSRMLRKRMEVDFTQR